jgi:hypothetical protein
VNATTPYLTAHQSLKGFDVNLPRTRVERSHVDVHTFPFQSSAATLLPGASRYTCPVHDVEFGNVAPRHTGFPFLDVPDCLIPENINFRYAVMLDRRIDRADGAIMLIHGLNERDWIKYLPWAHRLAELTGKALVLLPLAFHVNRAPADWSAPRTMKPVAMERHRTSPAITCSTFANAAISSRLEAQAERLVWSGLQTLHDVNDFVDHVRAGSHPLIAPDAGIDFFGYSIGALLAQILLLADPGERYTASRTFLFCGGSTLDRMNPNSRYILDSDAAIALYSFYTARFESELRLNPRLEHYMSDQHPEGQAFRAMLDARKGRNVREEGFRRIATRMAAFALEQDAVVPAQEIANTLKGSARDLPAEVRITDFPYPYNHVIPFPLGESPILVEKAFTDVFSSVADHLA